METQYGYEVCKRMAEIWECRLFGLSESSVKYFNSAYHCWDLFAVVSFCGVFNPWLCQSL